MSKKPKKQKLPPGITEEFIDKVSSLDAPGQKALIVEIQKGLDDARTFLKENEEIQSLRAELDLVAGPTRDTIKHLSNRTKMVIDELKKSGSL